MATGTADEIEEERRLLYVAMTRAKDQLMLMVPQRFYTHQQAKRGDRHVYAQRTRFMRIEIVDRFERVAWPGSHVGRSVLGAGSVSRVDLSARMRGMWGRTGT